MFSRSQLEHAVKETERPLRVTGDCIYKRENRMGIDRVKDEVEGRLYQESSQIVNTQNRLKDQLNSVHLIIFLNCCVGWGARSTLFAGQPADKLQSLRQTSTGAGPQQQGFSSEHRPQCPGIPQQLSVIIASTRTHFTF